MPADPRSALRALRARSARARSARARSARAWSAVLSAGAVVVVLGVLIAPVDAIDLQAVEFARIPVEALAGVVVLLVLPVVARRPVAAVAGFVLGLLTLVKIVDIGFSASLGRPFDLVFDWPLLRAGQDFVAASAGPAAASGALIAAVVLAVAVLGLVTGSAVRVASLVGRHASAASGSAVALTTAWVTCAVLGAQLVPGLSVASTSTSALARDRVLQIGAGLHDREAFAAEAAADAFADVPDERLLTALRGKDVLVTFVESYGRSAVEDPRLSAGIRAVLDDGTRQLAAAGYRARSAYLTSPITGGSSWLAHATLLSGLRVGNQQRYRTLVASDRLTLTGAFRSAGWRTVAVEAGLTQAWPEGEFFGYQQVYDSRNLGYSGPSFGWAPMPDQYILSRFQRTERGRPGTGPIMAGIPLVSSHTPWAPLPSMVDWSEAGDSAVYGPMAARGDSADAVWQDQDRVRAAYASSVEYSLRTLVSYVLTYGDEDLVLVFLGDHQPAPIVTGTDAGRDVPITIVTRDTAVLDRIVDWNWSAGLRPSNDAPVWPMESFRDRFLTAYSGGP